MLRGMKRLGGTLLIASMVTACAQSPGTPDMNTIHVRSGEAIARLIAAARVDRSKEADLAKMLMSGPVFVIPDPNAKSPTLLFFDQPERSFIPVFSSRDIFDEEAYGTGFEGKAISIDARNFASLLHGDEVVILNPGHRPAIEFSASELRALVPK